MLINITDNDIYILEYNNEELGALAEVIKLKVKTMNSNEDEVFYPIAGNKIPSGFLPLLQFHFDRKGLSLNIQDDRTVKPLEEVGDIITEFGNLTLRDYQEEAVREAIKAGRGFIELPTGTGKTLIIAGILKNLDIEKAVIITPSISLAEQIKRDLSYMLNEEIGIMNSSAKVKKNITVTTYATFKKRPTEFMNVDVLIMDEVHHLTGIKTFEAVWRNPARYKFGLSATATIDKINMKYIYAILGNCIYKKSIGELTEYLPEPSVLFFKMKYEDGRFDNLQDITPFQRYRLEIIRNPVRNRLIARLGGILVDAGLNTLILCSKREHAYYIHMYLRQLEGIDVPIIWSNVSANLRNDIVQNFEKYKIAIATTIFDEGINIPSLNVIINATGEASSIKTIQRAGRGFRKTENKSNLLIIDFIDSFSRHAEYKSKLRADAYLKEIPKENVNVLMGEFSSTEKNEAVLESLKGYISKFSSSLDLVV